MPPRFARRPLSPQIAGEPDKAVSPFAAGEPAPRLVSPPEMF